MLLDEIGWNVVTMRDRRYDMIIHLISQEKEAEQFYSLPENKINYEQGVKTAKIIDKNTINAWIGHQNFHIIDNKKMNAKKKKSMCLEIILQYLGMPGAVTFYKKYLIKKPSQFDI